MGVRVGPQFDVAKLKAMLDAHIAAGGTSVDGDDATRLLDSQGANGMYWPREGGPGTLILRSDARRLEVREEFLHVEQYRLRGWPTTDPQINPLLRIEIEIEAQTKLLQIAQNENWTKSEVLKIRANQRIWRMEYARMRRR